MENESRITLRQSIRHRTNQHVPVGRRVESIPSWSPQRSWVEGELLHLGVFLDCVSDSLAAEARLSDPAIGHVVDVEG
jgi:hypothetical protein